MPRLCPPRPTVLLVAALLTLPLIACGGSASPAPTPTPDANQALGLEIAQTYGALLQRARDLVEPRPPTPEVREQLRVLREEYRVQFGNFACLLGTLPAAAQVEVAAAFDAGREDFLPEDMAWLEDAAGDYDLEDTAVRPILEDLLTLDDYAFIDRVAASRPGEQLLCG